MPKTYYITTAIDYPNAPPHIGHAYEKIIADALARWHTLKQEKVYFLTGTDEHGQKIERAAKKANKTPQQFVDEITKQFENLCKQLNISNNDFIRTTQPRHQKLAQQLFKKAQDKKLIYKGTYTGLYCIGCEQFYLERELIDGKCTIHKTQPEQISEESYFFKLSKYQQKIIQHIQKNPEFIQPEARRNEILNRLKEPLRDLSVSRTTFTWGIKVPDDEKHVIYVWFDALLNYISGSPHWPAQCHIIGKDISWFHCVIWPAILIASGYKLPKTVYSHGWLTVNGQKMSKTQGNVIDPIKIIENYGADALRYYLLREVPPGEDGDYTEDIFITKTNADLADALGNLLQRTSVLIHKNYNGKIPTCAVLTKDEKELIKQIPKIKELDTLMQKYQWNICLEKIWNYIYSCNKYVNTTEPWKQTGKRLDTILYTLTEHLRIIGILISPFIPTAAQQITKQIGQKQQTFKETKFKKTTTGTYEQPTILFKKNMIQQKDPASILNLKVAKILDVQNHPQADKLYVLQLDSGEKRQIVAGMRPYYKPEELLGKKIVLLTNLKPAVIRGVESQGMMLAAEKNGIVKIIEPQGEAGEQVTIQGITPSTETITIDDFMKIKLTTKNKNVVYGDKKLMTEKIIEIEMPDDSTIR